MPCPMQRRQIADRLFRQHVAQGRELPERIQQLCAALDLRELVARRALVTQPGDEVPVDLVDVAPTAARERRDLAEVPDVVVDEPGVDKVLDRVVEAFPPPEGDPKAPLRALIFDAVYDEYRGVIVYLRVVDVCEELVKFTWLTRGRAAYLTDRYSERVESAEAVSRRVNQSTH